MRHGGEASHGRVDHKEGLYLGFEHDPSHQLFGAPLHGHNQWPRQVPELRSAALRYLADGRRAGLAITDALSLGLLQDAGYMREHCTTDDPVVIFRAFLYPDTKAMGDDHFGVGEHSDFGLLTLLRAESEGLEYDLAGNGVFVPVPPKDGALVVSVGDMLDRMSGGVLVSRRHRVRNHTGRPRLSFPLFFDFAWTARIHTLPVVAYDELGLDEEARDALDKAVAAKDARWATTTFTAATGVWSQYLAKKVAKVFPEALKDLPEFEANRTSSRFVIRVPPPSTGGE